MEHCSQQPLEICCHKSNQRRHPKLSGPSRCESEERLQQRAEHIQHTCCPYQESCYLEQLLLARVRIQCGPDRIVSWRRNGLCLRLCRLPWLRTYVVAMVANPLTYVPWTPAVTLLHLTGVPNIIVMTKITVIPGQYLNTGNSHSQSSTNSKP